ncbi:MAG TPA: sigma 54-interacting transcriptional regulator [Clostridiales bacterium]|nr:sigma 54-interacting transcriptional regulator [Clostridiales bacterium]
MTNKKDLEALSWIADHAADSVCVCDGEGKIIYLNQAAADLVAPQSDFSGFIGKDETTYFGVPSAVQICADRRDMALFRKEMPSGKILDVTVFPLHGESGEIAYMIESFREREAADNSPDQDENILFIYKSSGMSQMMSLASKIAKIDSTVMIKGESGTGKVMLGQYIHRYSNRRNGAFVSLNCAAMSGEQLAEELFGLEGGPGEPVKPGMIDVAAGGTLFLDEIDALPLSLQTRFLYDLHEQVYRPIGGRKGIPIDCRLIAATDRNLHELVAKGEFREDLYYLINVFEITIPPIRERTMDILPMITHLMERYNRRYGMNRRISDAAIDVLSQYRWPGNIREMDNTIERLVAMAPEDIIDTHHLPDQIRFQVATESGAGEGKGSLEQALAEVEKDIIVGCYEECGSSYEVARVLKISQSKASRLIRKYCHQKGRKQ